MPARRDADARRTRPGCWPRTGASATSAAGTLQRTLLPPALAATCRDCEVAAHYHIASLDEVGGDFYDLFPLAAGTVGVLPGRRVRQGRGSRGGHLADPLHPARGRGLRPRPAAVLTQPQHRAQPGVPRPRPAVLHRDVRAARPRHAGALHRSTLASGGHPPALLLRADGTAELPAHPRRPAHRRPARRRTSPPPRCTWTRGHAAALHRRPDRGAQHAGPTDPAAHNDRYGETALLALATRLAPTTAPDLIHALTDLLDSFGDGLDDDTALLALSVPARPADGESR